MFYILWSSNLILWLVGFNLLTITSSQTLIYISYFLLILSFLESVLILSLYNIRLEYRNRTNLTDSLLDLVSFNSVSLEKDSKTSDESNRSKSNNSKKKKDKDKDGILSECGETFLDCDDCGSSDCGGPDCSCS